MASNAYKNELTFGIDSFNEPKELLGPEAWAQLVTQLLFTIPGTFPSMPTLGIGIQQYEYEFLEDKRADIEQSIRDQCGTYLPDIPIQSISLTPKTIGEKEVLVIMLAFVYNQEIVQAAVAADTQSSILGFEIAWI